MIFTHIHNFITFVYVEMRTLERKNESFEKVNVLSSSRPGEPGCHVRLGIEGRRPLCGARPCVRACDVSHPSPHGASQRQLARPPGLVEEMAWAVAGPYRPVTQKEPSGQKGVLQPLEGASELACLCSPK